MAYFPYLSQEKAPGNAQVRLFLQIICSDCGPTNSVKPLQQ